MYYECKQKDCGGLFYHPVWHCTGCGEHRRDAETVCGNCNEARPKSAKVAVALQTA